MLLQLSQRKTCFTVILKIALLVPQYGLFP